MYIYEPKYAVIYSVLLPSSQIAEVGLYYITRTVYVLLVAARVQSDLGSEDIFAYFVRNPYRASSSPDASRRRCATSSALSPDLVLYSPYLLP